MSLGLLQSRPQVVGEIPDGVEGVRETVKIMCSLVKQFRKDARIREIARSLVYDLPPKAFRLEAERIFDFVRSSIRYLQDTHDVELIHDPITLLEVGQGDCDDMSVLAASLLESIGHPIRFVVTGYTAPDVFEHVYVETLIGTRWIALECTEDVPFGWAMPGAVARMVFNV